MREKAAFADVIQNASCVQVVADSLQGPKDSDIASVVSVAKLAEFRLWDEVAESLVRVDPQKIDEYVGSHEVYQDLASRREDMVLTGSDTASVDSEIHELIQTDMGLRMASAAGLIALMGSFMPMSEVISDRTTPEALRQELCRLHVTEIDGRMILQTKDKLLPFAPPDAQTRDYSHLRLAALQVLSGLEPGQSVPIAVFKGAMQEIVGTWLTFDEMKRIRNTFDRINQLYEGGVIIHNGQTGQRSAFELKMPLELTLDSARASATLLPKSDKVITEYQIHPVGSEMFKRQIDGALENAMGDLLTLGPSESSLPIEDWLTAWDKVDIDGAKALGVTPRQLARSAPFDKLLVAMLGCDPTIHAYFDHDATRQEIKRMARARIQEATT